MHLRGRDKDRLGSTLLFIVGAGTVFFSSKYDLGTTMAMGPGYFPVVLGALLCLFATLSFAVTFRGVEGESATISFTSIFWVLGSCIVFALLLFPAGLLIATFASVLVASFASRQTGPVAAIVLALVLAAACALTFVVGLGQQIPLLGYWLGA